MPVARNVGGVGDAVGPEAWFRSLPIITRYYFGSAVLVTLGANFGLIKPNQLLFFWPLIKRNFELWRFLTCFCFIGPFSFNTMIATYTLVQFSKIYESGGPFNTGAGGGTADYAFCLMFGMIAIICTYPLVDAVVGLPPNFAMNLIYYVMYVWSKRNPTVSMSIWGIPIQGVYLPFAYLALHVFMGHYYMDLIHGVMIGHVYYFLVDVLPQVHGKDVLHTPQFLIDQFGIGEYQPDAAAVRPPPGREPAAPQGGAGFTARAPPQQRQAGGGGYNWGGGGRPLGHD